MKDLINLFKELFMFVKEALKGSAKALAELLKKK